MSLTAVRSIVEPHLKSFWGSTTDIVWDNVRAKPKPGSSLLRVQLDGIGSNNTSLACTREFYILTIQVLVPAEIGVVLSDQYVDTIINNFKRYASGWLTCTKASFIRVGDEREWFQRNVDVEMQYDQHS